MKISELIEKASKIQKEHGDLEVGVYNPEFGAYSVVSEVNMKTLQGVDDMYGDDEDLGERFLGIS